VKVRCYWNLHKRLWSIQDAKTRRIVGHADKLLLRDATFTTSEAGRMRVRKEGKKNVHAFACGTLEAADWTDCRDRYAMHWNDTERANTAYASAAWRLGVPVTYNPYQDDGFVCLMEGHRLPIAGDVGMAYLSKQNRRPCLLVFDPCDMTQAESERATQ
jgi:hypothetical protein